MMPGQKKHQNIIILSIQLRLIIFNGRQVAYVMHRYNTPTVNGILK